MFRLSLISIAIAVFSQCPTPRAGAAEPREGGDSQLRIEFQGPFLAGAGVVGEQKEDGVQPSHPYCWQLSRDRWIWVFQTRGFEGVNDGRSILFQIRRDRPDGPVMFEDVLQDFCDDWDPFGDGSHFGKIHGHPKIFGVPRGAVDRNLNPIAHDNLFVAVWSTRAGAVTPDGKPDPGADEKLAGTLRLEWMQFRLSDAGDDIEFLTDTTELRQSGCESGPQFCELADARTMDQWVHPPEPLDDNFSRWVDTPHFNDNGIAAIEYRYDPRTELYEWVRSGPMVKAGPGKGTLVEGSLNRVGEEWILCATNRCPVREGRRGSGAAWFRARDPFAGFGRPVFAPVPSSDCPPVAWQMPDGVLRIFSGEIPGSPRSRNLDPLFCWDVNPDDFSISNRRAILDAKPALGMPEPVVRFANLSPVHDSRQILTCRVTPMKHPEPDGKSPVPVGEPDLAQTGAHYSVIRYPRGTVENTWLFDE